VGAVRDDLTATDVVSLAAGVPLIVVDRHDCLSFGWAVTPGPSG
jgi:hypothetical protein